MAVENIEGRVDVGQVIHDGDISLMGGDSKHDLSLGRAVIRKGEDGGRGQAMYAIPN